MCVYITTTRGSKRVARAEAMPAFQRHGAVDQLAADVTQESGADLLQLGVHGCGRVEGEEGSELDSNGLIMI
jgi:hypothetical protein